MSCSDPWGRISLPSGDITKLKVDATVNLRMRPCLAEVGWIARSTELPVPGFSPNVGRSAGVQPERLG
jgi:hypothetical protein